MCIRDRSTQSEVDVQIVFLVARYSPGRGGFEHSNFQAQLAHSASMRLTTPHPLPRRPAHELSFDRLI
eukprot:3395486-Alexandrium_andersonii.AAC.1